MKTQKSTAAGTSPARAEFGPRELLRIALQIEKRQIARLDRLTPAGRLRRRHGGRR